MIVIRRKAVSTVRRARGRPRRAHDSRATRKSLLNAAAALFAARGFDGVSVAEVARLAGANKALINYHFGGKLQLYRTIVREMFAELLSRLEPMRWGLFRVSCQRRCVRVTSPLPPVLTAREDP